MLAKAQGWSLDATHDLARVLRLPGTYNHKTEIKAVQIIETTDNRYDPSEFEQYLPALGAAHVSSAPRQAPSVPQAPPGPASLILEQGRPAPPGRCPAAAGAGVVRHGH